MRYVFVLGLGRSGTSWVSRVLATTNTPHIYFEEPFTKLKHYPHSEGMIEPWSVCPYAEQEKINWFTDIIENLPYDYENMIRERLINRSVFSNSSEYNEYKNSLKTIEAELMEKVYNIPTKNRDLTNKEIINKVIEINLESWEKSQDLIS